MAQCRLIYLLCACLLGLLGAQCSPGRPAATPTPTRTRIALALPTTTFTPSPTAEPTLSPTPIPTASPTAAPPTVLPSPTSSPPPAATEPLPTATSTPLPPAATARPPQATATPAPPSRPPLPPQQGGEWDMEAGFLPGSSPLGENCPGWSVAAGWAAFVAPGIPASSCLNENKNLANVHSGQRSQEITFDFINAEAGIYRRAQTVPGHRYRIEAWGKHIHSGAPVALSLGVDLGGGEDWQGGSVTWYPWDETQEDAWVHTQVTVQAKGEGLTLFLKGSHPVALQGGATLFDDVRVLDLGP